MSGVVKDKLIFVLFLDPGCLLTVPVPVTVYSIPLGFDGDLLTVDSVTSDILPNSTPLTRVC